MQTRDDSLSYEKQADRYQTAAVICAAINSCPSIARAHPRKLADLKVTIGDCLLTLPTTGGGGE